MQRRSRSQDRHLRSKTLLRAQGGSILCCVLLFCFGFCVIGWLWVVCVFHVAVHTNNGMLAIFANVSLEFSNFCVKHFLYYLFAVADAFCLLLFLMFLQCLKLFYCFLVSGSQGFDFLLICQPFFVDPACVFGGVFYASSFGR